MRIKITGGCSPPSGLDPLKGLDADAVWAWMDNYCLTHPLVTIDAATETFVHEHPDKD